MSLPFNQFMFATGIENSYPTIQWKGQTVRVDEMEKTGHYRHWRDDFGLVKHLGIRHLRYGPPYYKTHVGPGRYDWDFTDETFHALRELHLTPIADLCHFGVPDWIGSFQNTEWPAQFAEYAAAFARRYPWVTLYTPVNEIFVAASFSAQNGWWNERLRSDEAFCRAIRNLCRANVLAMRAILEHQPEAVFIQSESSEFFHPEEPRCRHQADFLNQKRFLALDLTYGHDVDVRIYEYLIDHGWTRNDYHWFLNHHVKARCVMGNDYYVTNEHIVKPDGSVDPSGEIFGYYVITRQYFRRYRLPVMHTETNFADPEMAPHWLRKEWSNLLQLKEDGVPILGFTWYSLTDQVDWDTGLRENNHHVDPLGLYDLERKIRPVGETYRRIIDTWRGIMPIGSSGLRPSF